MSALSPRQMFLLDMACYPISNAFDCWGTYLVGTAVLPRDGKEPRDIDVRSIMRDKAYDKLRKAIGLDGSRNPLGDRDLSRFRGDAQTVDMERLFKSRPSVAAVETPKENTK